MSLRSLKQLLIGLSFFASATAFATPYTVDISGAQSFAAFGSAANTVSEINVGANASIVSVSFNVNLTAFAPSFLSELSLAFTNSGVTEGVFLTPGIDDSDAGTATYSEFIDLVANGLSFNVDADGILRLEFFERFNDASVSPDGIWNFGTITFNTDAVGPSPVPEPATGVLIGAGLALLACHTRRRRAPSKAA